MVITIVMALLFFVLSIVFFAVKAVCLSADIIQCHRKSVKSTTKRSCAKQRDYMPYRQRDALRFGICN